MGANLFGLAAGQDVLDGPGGPSEELADQHVAVGDCGCALGAAALFVVLDGLVAEADLLGEVLLAADTAVEAVAPDDLPQVLPVLRACGVHFGPF